MGPSLTKIALAGKPFSGKSLLAQQLAEQHNLRVLMPQEITQLAVKAAMRAQATPTPHPHPHPHPHPDEAAYLAGFAPLEAFCAALHPALIAPRLPFLPLLCTSVYCALGVHYCFGLALAFSSRSSEEARGGLKTA